MNSSLVLFKLKFLTGTIVPVCAMLKPFMPWPGRKDLTQQHGFFHAGVMTTIADSAAGYAAFSLMPAEWAVLATEFKVNLLSPGKGDYIIGTGKVIKPGKTLTVSSMEVHAIDEATGKSTLCLTGLQTSIALPPSRGIQEPKE